MRTRARVRGSSARAAATARARRCVARSVRRRASISFAAVVGVARARARAVPSFVHRVAFRVTRFMARVRRVTAVRCARGWTLAAVVVVVVAVSARVGVVAALDAVEPDADDAAFAAHAERARAARAETDGEVAYVYAAIEDEDGGVGRTRGVFARDAGERGRTIERVVGEGAIRAGGTTADAGREDGEWALAIELMLERSLGAASRHAPFVKSLYERTPALGTKISAKARERLREHYAERVADEYDDNLARGWKRASETFAKFPTIFSSEDFTREGFEEALAIVRATSFETERENGSRERVLVPLAHLIPHDTASVVPCVKMIDGVYEINVDEHRAGEEFSCSHGNFSDAETFARFGASALYSMEKNPMNSIAFRFPDEIHLREELEMCGSPRDIGFTRAGASPELMCALRLVSANDTEWRKLKGSREAIRRLRVKPIGEESELAVYEALFATLTDLLDSYPYSDVDDDYLLLDTRLLEDERRAVQIRLKEKRLALSSLDAIQHLGRKQFGGLLFDKRFADFLPSLTPKKNNLPQKDEL